MELIKRPFDRPQPEPEVDYKEMYLTMFRAAGRAIGVIDAAPVFNEDMIMAKAILAEAQCKCEDMYIGAV